MKYVNNGYSQGVVTVAAPEIQDNLFYYPKNLRTKYKVLLWTIFPFITVIVCTMISFFIWSSTKSTFPLIITAAIAFMTASFDDITIGSRIVTKLVFLIKPQHYKNAVKPNSTQKLCGGQYITPQTNIYITQSGRYAMWQIQPYNLSVLSPGATETLIRSMTYLLSQVPELEILATDAARSFENNIGFLKRRIEAEDNPAVKELLKSDLEEITAMSVSSTNSRRYLLLLKMPRQPETQDESTCKRTGKAIQDAGFNAVQLDKKEIKSVLANYLDIVSEIPDIDGNQFITEGDFSQ